MTALPSPRRPAVARYLATAASATVAAALLAGCAATGPRAEGEKKLNDWIGHSIAGSYLDTDELIQKKEFDANRMQYIMPDQSGCTIGFVVDKRTKILMSWSYLKSPEKCWISRSAL
ncbi:MAG TPA: hypothetical protein VGE70_03920 [Burkholderiaceae bacterium]